MLISTSRKPSQKTRKFCKNLSHAFDYDYVNRGKSSIRDLLVKSKELGRIGVLLVYEIKGNPSKLTFLSENGEEELAILISAETANTWLHIKPSELKIKNDFPDLAPLADILGLDVVDGDLTSNYLHFRPADDYEFEDGRIAVIDFYNKHSDKIDLQINVKKIVIE